MLSTPIPPELSRAMASVISAGVASYLALNCTTRIADGVALQEQLVET